MFVKTNTMSGIIGIKVGMTSLYDEDGYNIPCTIIRSEPCQIVQIKTLSRDKYEAIQLGFGDKKEKNTPKALLGHFKKANVSPKQKLIEFPFLPGANLGDKIGVDFFSKGDVVSITGISKGKGFQGVVKRHGFSGVGESTHGQHNRLRAPGSIGAGSTPSRVFKGMRMAGRMGGDRITTKLEIFDIDLDMNILIVKGSVPGAINSYLIIKKWN